MPYQEIIPGCTCPSCISAEAVDDEYDDDDYDPEDDDGYDDDGYYVEPIYGHGRGPGLMFRGDGPLYLGFELEVEVPDTRSFVDYARKVQKRFGDSVWLQEDGSIRHGFEITSHPMSYPWAMESFPWEVLPTLESEGCYVTRHVGLHVHVSRAAFLGECHTYRWLKFVYRNAPQVTTLARRSSGEWASFDPLYRRAARHYAKGKKGGDDTYNPRTGLYEAPWNRYQAVNPVNDQTLEVRVFGSSLRPREVQAALAFCASTVEYTRDLDANKIINERGWAWSSYVDWTRERPQYRPITKELEALSCVS